MSIVNNEVQADGVNELPRSQFEELKLLITSVGNDINGRIDQLEKKLTNDINELRSEDRRIAELIHTNKDHSDAEFVKLKEQLDSRDEEIRGQSNALIEARGQIDALSNKVTTLEKASYRGLQHGREWNVEIDGIPSNIGDDPRQLEDAVVTLLGAINVEADHNDIDKIHRLPSRNNDEPKPVIIRFHSRKLVQCIHENKRKLKDLGHLNVDIAGLRPDSRIYIRASLCSYYNNLAYNCRILKRAKLIESSKVSYDGKISIKTLDGSFVKIVHESDLLSRFPRFQRFNFNSNNE